MGKRVRFKCALLKGHCAWAAEDSAWRLHEYGDGLRQLHSAS